MDVGAELREARLKAGLSREAVSQRTKIQLAKIEALEANAFERLPEGIYLHGLIRAYATEVGLDGSEMVARLQRHDAMPLEDQLAADEGADHFTTGAAPVAPPVHDAPLTADRATDRAIADDADDPADYMVPAIASAPFTAESAYTAPPVGPAVPPPSAPGRGFGRSVLLILALAAAIGVGAVLYERDRWSIAPDEIDSPVVSHDADTPGADAAAAGRNATAIPDEAVPADRPSSVEHHADSAPDAPTISPADRPAGDPPTVDPPEAAAAGVRAAPRDRNNARSAPGTSSAPEARGASGSAPAVALETEAAGERSAANETGAVHAPDVSGAWTLNTQVESSSVRDYEGLKLGYRVTLQQSGSRISGEGVKLLENGKRIATAAQTPIVVTGTVDGNRLTLTFTERGRRRESGGRMILDVQDDGVMRGRFSSSAARSTGTAEARRSQS